MNRFFHTGCATVVLILIYLFSTKQLNAQTPLLQSIPSCGNTNSVFASLSYSSVACYTGSDETVALNLTGTETLVIKSGASITFSTVSIASGARLFVEAGASVVIIESYTLNGTIVNYGSIVQANMSAGVTGLVIADGAVLYNENNMKVGGVLYLEGTSFTLVNGGNFSIGYDDYSPTTTFGLDPLIALCHNGCTYTGTWTLRPGSILNIVGSGMSGAMTGAIGAPGGCVTNPAGGLFQSGTGDISGNVCSNKARINFHGTLAPMDFVAQGYGATNHLINDANIVLVGGGSVTGDPTAGCSHVSYVGSNTNNENSGGEDPRKYELTTFSQSPLPSVPATFINYCEGAIAQIGANGLTSSTGLTWYTSLTGTTGQTTTTPTPVTSNGTAPITYYVSQTVNGCEGPRASIHIKVSTIITTPNSIEITTFSTGCIGEELSLIAPSGYTEYNWSGPYQFTDATENPSISNAATTNLSGQYILIVTDGTGSSACHLSATKNIEVGKWMTIPDLFDAYDVTCTGFSTGWNGDAMKYLFEVSSTSSFTSSDVYNIDFGDAYVDAIGLNDATTYYFRVRVDNIGCPGDFSAVKTVTTLTDVSSPVFTQGAASTRCQGYSIVTYTATAANASGSITYSLDATSLAGGNTINASTGVVTFAKTWSGVSTITATAPGCNGFSTAQSTHTVTTNAAPVIANFPTSGLIAYYKMDGNANDDLGFNHGTIQNGATPSTDRFSRSNSSYFFSGINKCITTSKSYNNPSKFSLSLWFRTSTTLGGRMIGFGDAQTGDSYYRDRMVWMDVTGKIHFGVNPAGAKVVTTDLPYNDNNWHHLVATCSNTAGEGISLYIDGVLIGTNTAGLGGENYIGYWRINYDIVGWGNSPANNCFNGYLDDVMIYDRRISAAEVATLFSSPEGPTANSPVCEGGTVNLSVPSFGGATYSWAGPNGFSTATQNPSITDMNAAKAGGYTVTATIGSCSTRGSINAVIDNDLGPSITQIQTSGLLHRFRFDGNANDAKGTNHGFLINNPSSAIDRFGNSNKAYSFNGSSQYITTQLRYTNPSTFTLALWFKTSVAGGKLIGFGNLKSGVSSSYDRHIYLDNTGKLHFGIYPNSTLYEVTSTSSYNDNAWHHVVATLSNTDGMKLYVDGVLIDSEVPAFAGGENYSGFWRIGYDNLSSWPGVSANYYFNGSIDDVLIYNTAISAADVLTLYKSPDGIITNSPVCVGTSLDLQTLSLAGATYSWTGPAGFTSTSQNAVVANNTGAIAGVYSLTVTSSTGCITRAYSTVASLAKPNDPLASNVSRCEAGTVTLTGSGSPLNYRWYDDPSAGSLVGSNASYTTPTINSTTTYYVVAVNASGCESTRVPVQAIIDVMPSDPVVADVGKCGPGSLDLTASGSLDTYGWYTVASGGTAIDTALTYTTPTISTNTIYYVSSINGSCESGRSAINITILPESVSGSLMVSATNVCADGNAGSISLNSFSGNVVEWLSSNDNFVNNINIITSTNTTEPFNNLTETTYFKAVVQNGTCPSDTTNSVMITVDPSTNAGYITVENLGFNESKLVLNGYTGEVTKWEASDDTSFTTSSYINQTTPELTVDITIPKFYRAYVMSGTCLEKSSEIVEVNSFAIYSSVTPNGDGINDVWVIQGIQLFPDNEVVIYDRIGDVVFKETGYNNTDKVWDGKSNAGINLGKQSLPEGTYYYHITINDSQTRTGYVVIKK